MTYAEIERAALEKAAERYRRDGYDVVVEPIRDELPERFRRFPPDMIARRDREVVAVDVVTKGSRSSGERARVTAEAAREIAGWEYELIVLPKPRPERKAMSEADAAARLKTSELVADHDPAASVLLTWTAAEWALRRLVGGDADGFENPRRLVKEAYSSDEVSERQYEALNRLADVRNAVLHGAIGERVSRATAHRAVRMVRSLVERAVSAAGATA